MIQQEGFTVNNRNYIHTYSDENYYILDSDNNKYVDAFDLPEAITNYIESDELIIEGIGSEHLSAKQLVAELEKIEVHAQKINLIETVTQDHTDFESDLSDAVAELGDLVANLLDTGEEE